MNKTLLTEEIDSEIETLRSLELGTNEYETAVNGITKLLDKAIEIEHHDTDRQDKLDLQCEQLDLQQGQLDLQTKQAKHDSRLKIATVAVTIGTAILTAAITVWGTNRTLEVEYEDDKIITTSAGKSFVGRLFKK